MHSAPASVIPLFVMSLGQHVRFGQHAFCCRYPVFADAVLFAASWPCSYIAFASDQRMADQPQGSGGKACSCSWRQGFWIGSPLAALLRCEPAAALSSCQWQQHNAWQRLCGGVCPAVFLVACGRQVFVGVCPLVCCLQSVCCLESRVCTSLDAARRQLSLGGP